MPFVSRVQLAARIGAAALPLRAAFRTGGSDGVVLNPGAPIHHHAGVGRRAGARGIALAAARPRTRRNP